MTTEYRRGFCSVADEHDRVPLHPEQQGRLPAWLRGSYIRNGPGRFAWRHDQVKHWFDGMAMLFRIEMHGDVLKYSNRFVRSDAFTQSERAQRLCFPGFASYPKLGFIRRLLAWFAKPESGHNTNVNILRSGRRYYALTEVSGDIEFDPVTLQTLTTIVPDDELAGEIDTAHPVYDPVRREFVNLSIRYGRRSFYCYYRQKDDIRHREKIACIPTGRPSYVHSFAMSENYIVHVESPLVVNPLRLRFGNLPYIECFRWRPERGVGIKLIERSSGRVTHRFEAEPFFAFHFINAFEQDGRLCFDVAAKNDASLIDDLYLDNLLHNDSRPIRQHSELRRYSLPLDGGTAVDCEVLGTDYVELPAYNAARCAGRRHRYVYAISHNTDVADDFENQLVKIDCDSRSSLTWYREHCYPAEPCFVAAPGAQAEDDGVILSIVLDADRGSSFLLLLDAKTFEEITRCYLPHVVPFGFHGQFYRDLTQQ